MPNTLNTFYRVGIVKPHGYRFEAYLALFTTEESAQHFENSILFGGWVSEPTFVAIPQNLPMPYRGGPLVKSHGRSESQASVRNRMLRNGS